MRITEHIDFVYEAPAEVQVAGPLSPQDITSRPAFGFAPWINPTNSMAADGIYTQADIDISHNPTHELYCSLFDFSSYIPFEATIVGIVVEVKFYASSHGVFDFLAPQLINADEAAWGDPKPNETEWRTSDDGTYVTYGSPMDTWAIENPDPYIINSSPFGVVISAFVKAGETLSAFIDHVRMTVYYTNS